MTANPWNKKQLRSMYDPTTQGYWFSVIDLCAILTDSDWKTARGYWKWLKDKQTSTKHQLVSVTNQLKFESLDGKYYFTEVLDFKSLINLIQTCPSPKANTYRLWLAEVLFASIPVAEIETQLAALGAETAAQIMEKYKYEGYSRMNVVREDLLAKHFGK